MNKLKFILLSSISAFSLISVAVGTVAWFNNTLTLSNIDGKISGDSAAAYFAYGDGSESKPYGIRTARQLYNLSWLQYNGNFNKDENKDNVLDKQYFFEIDPEITEINMKDWILPPIGTKEYPFVGSFNGNNKTIKSLTVSNKNNLSKPNAIEYDEQPEIVGMFGVVGTIDSLPYTYTESKNVVKDVTLDTITVESKTPKTLIGIAAGYMDGEMSGVEVTGTATLDVNSQSSTALTEIEGVEKLSDYGLVGYTTKSASKGSYSQELSEYYNNGDESGGGEGDDWGGSINPRKYSRLIFDHYKGTNAYGLTTSTMSANTDYTINSSPSGNFKIALRCTTPKTEPYTKDPSQYSYYTDPDYFNNPPDGAYVRTTTSKTVLYHIRDGAYIPLRFSDDTNTDTHEKNTGYIIGSSSGNAGSPKVSSGYISNIMNAIGNTSESASARAYQNYPTMEYVDSNLEVITYSTKDDKWYTVKDSHNSGHTSTNSTLTTLQLSNKTVSQLGFEKYDKARSSLQSVLETAPRLNAIKFDNTTVSSSNLLNVTSGQIKINNSTFNTSNSTPYQFPKGSIDFNLKKTGYINFFAGTYYLSTTSVSNFSFFTLNHIQRTNGTISSLKKISEIYRNKYWNDKQISDSETNPKYFYKYSDDTFSNIVVNGAKRAATLSDKDTAVGDNGLEFAASYALESPLGTSSVSVFKKAVNNLVFYFEVPVNNGEYAMGMAPNPNPTKITSFTGAYMMYLDIGANGDAISTDSVNAHSITTKREGNTYPVGIDFIPIDVTGDGGDSISISIDSGSQGIATFIVSSNSITVTDTSSIAKYAYRSTNYVVSSPTETQFTCNLPGAPPTISSGGERVLMISLETVDDDVYTIRITDQLSDNAGTISSSTYELDDGSGSYVTVTSSQIEALSEEISISQLRQLVTVTTLTRTAGSKEFFTTYDEDNCSYQQKIVAVNVELNGCTIQVGTITDGYSLFVNGVQKSANAVVS